MRLCSRMRSCGSTKCCRCLPPSCASPKSKVARPGDSSPRSILARLATELAESFAPVVLDSGRTLLWSIEPGLTIEGDRELLSQAGINLLENALRHTPAGTIIRLTLVSAGAHACFQVVDNGPGVAKADRDKVVKRFTRLDRSRNTSGFGLGLNLVAAVAKSAWRALAAEGCQSGTVGDARTPPGQAEG